MAVAQRELVEKHHWFTPAEFVEEWAVAQILPGPNVMNLVMAFGMRCHGWRGAAAAIVGVVVPPLCLLLLIAGIYTSFANHPRVQGALRGMGAVAAGLILATGIKLIPALRQSPMGWISCLVIGCATFIAIAVLRLPLLWVLLFIGLPAIAWAWRQLARKE